ncbi:hypothetical protein [Paenibacillus sp.]|uniref:hypothetical protein n=1 Tax=Paenibacillus sp. TaxID=58172 RepID=UPI002D223E98|nr:hypothetical protein [Paenibacillus sp.]HZG55062.1 hypothetical protein [Paenibacillus sp.]
MKYYEESVGGALREAVDRLVGAWDGVGRRRMFGCPCYTANGKLFAVVVNGGVVLTKLSSAEARDRGSPLPVEPFRTGNKSVGAWSAFAVASPAEAALLADWIKECYLAALAEASGEGEAR